MSLRDALRKAFGWGAPPAATHSARPAVRTGAPAEEHELRVPEVTSVELLAEISQAERRPMLLDCREHYERAQAFIPDSLHIPMNSIPHRLSELDPAQEIVVYCAHGNRSYGVAGWLIQQGYQARSLKGGIVDWQLKHGPVESGYRPRP